MESNRPSFADLPKEIQDLIVRDNIETACIMSMTCKAFPLDRQRAQASVTRDLLRNVRLVDGPYDVYDFGSITLGVRIDNVAAMVTQLYFSNRTGQKLWVRPLRVTEGASSEGQAQAVCSWLDDELHLWLPYRARYSRSLDSLIPAARMLIRRLYGDPPGAVVQAILRESYGELCDWLIGDAHATAFDFRMKLYSEEADAVDRAAAESAKIAIGMIRSVTGVPTTYNDLRMTYQLATDEASELFDESRVDAVARLKKRLLF